MQQPIDNLEGKFQADDIALSFARQITFGSLCIYFCQPVYLLETDEEVVEEEEQVEGEGEEEEDGGIEAVEIEEEKCTECISKETVLADPEHPANFVMCTDQLDQCPITGISLKFSEEKQNLEIGFSRKASNLPLLKFKIS